MADVTVNTSKEYKRDGVIYKLYPKEIPRRALAFGATDTTKNFTVNAKGKLHSYLLEVPDFTNTVTATLTILNADSKEIYNSGAKAKGDDYFVSDVDRLITGETTIKVTLAGGIGSGAPGGSGGSVYFTGFLEE